MSRDLNFCRKCGDQMILHDSILKYYSKRGWPVYEGKLTCPYRYKFPLLGAIAGHDSFSLVFFDFQDFVDLEGME